MKAEGVRAVADQSQLAVVGLAEVVTSLPRIWREYRRLVEAAQREGALRADVDPVDVLRLAHGVATASELANGDGSAVRRYVSLLTEGLRPAR